MTWFLGLINVDEVENLNLKSMELFCEGGFNLRKWIQTLLIVPVTVVRQIVTSLGWKKNKYQNTIF